jgi:outer membrane protein OmpA-like peptidoglycan-associated protein
MRSLTTRRGRRCDQSPPYPTRGSAQAAAGSLRHPILDALALLAAAWLGSELTAAPALAQRSAVTVDLGALDALGSPSPTANPADRIRLHRPQPPTERTTTAKPPGQLTSVEASVPRPAPPPPQTSALPAIAPPKASTPPASTPPSTPAVPQQAMAPPAPAASGGAPPAPPGEATKHILFRPDEASLPDDAKAELDGLATRLSLDGHLYVQLVAYAGDSGDASQARRLSLTRALAARSYLVERGVEIKQVDVRPLGNKSEPGLAPDRIDLVIAQR